MRKLLLILAFISLGACGGTDKPGEFGDKMSALETALQDNTSWPYEAVGVLDIVEAGFDGTSEYAEWGVGSLITEDDDEWGISVTLRQGVAARAEVDIDSGEKVRVWLEAPVDEFGYTTYPISRMEKL